MRTRWSRPPRLGAELQNKIEKPRITRSTTTATEARTIQLVRHQRKVRQKTEDLDQHEDFGLLDLIDQAVGPSVADIERQLIGQCTPQKEDNTIVEHYVELS